MCYEFGTHSEVNFVTHTDGAPETLVPIYQSPRRREDNEKLSQLPVQHTRTPGQNQNVVQ